MAEEEPAEPPQPRAASNEWTRRAFLDFSLAAAAACAMAWWLGSGRRTPRGTLEPTAVDRIPGQIVGQSVRSGHLLRPGQSPPWVNRSPTERRRVRTAIVGSGIAGLSAAWAFNRAGWDDYLMLELEGRVGGTATWNEYPASACPWGAHYLPLPTTDSRAVRLILQEFGAILGYRPDGTPRYEETYLCQAPQERLFEDGMWIEGLWPAVGAKASDNAQLDSFHARMDRWRSLVGRDGRPAFTIPIAMSSRDPELLALDRISMREYLHRGGWTSPRVHWYVEYGTRDDYGCTLDNTSAWAGIHYYASRTDRPRALRQRSDTEDLLTWPQGNGWFVQRLRAGVGERRLITKALVFRVEANERAVDVDWWDGRQVHRVTCDSVVLAVPRFIAERLCAAYARQCRDSAGAFSYTPWIVSNVVVDRLPANDERLGVPIAWDNVIFNSPTLGYVVATHQSLATVDSGSVLTHYQPLVQGDPRQRRAWALQQPWTSWRDGVLRDLAVPHPNIEQSVQRLDVMVWGHAMIRPRPGFMWGPDRMAAGRGVPRVWLAHTDMSGIAIFEEANYHGIAAAQAIMGEAKHRFEDVL